MDKIVYRLVYNRKKTLNARGLALVQVEAYQEKRKKYFSTHVYLKPEQWDARRRQVKNHPEAVALNYRLAEFVAGIERKELHLWRQGQAVSLDKLKDALEARHVRQTFTDFFAAEVREAGVKESTRHNLGSTLSLLKRFRPCVQFADLTYEFVADFELYLRQAGYHPNTVAKHLKHLKQQINQAVRRGYLEADGHPFRDYPIKTAAYSHTYLTPDELRLMERLASRVQSPELGHTLDAFLFCCYAGLRYSDFVHLSAANLLRVEDASWLSYHSVKTGAHVRLPLSLLFDGKALAILEKYAGRLEDFFRLKNNSNVNKHLRVLGSQAGVSKRVTFHTARHTNATLLIYKGVNITTVPKLLGHKNVKTTQVYAEVMDPTIVRDLEAHRR